MAEIRRYIRLVNGDRSSEWLPKGVFYVNRRSWEDGLWSIEAYDAMLKADITWTPRPGFTFPATMEQADLTHSAADALSEGRTAMAAASVGNYALFGGGQSGSNNQLSSVVDAYDALLTRSTPTPLVKNERCKAAANSSYAVFCGTMISAYNTSLTRSIPSLPSWVNSSIDISSITATRAGKGGNKGDHQS